MNKPKFCENCEQSPICTVLQQIKEISWNGHQGEIILNIEKCDFKEGKKK